MFFAANINSAEQPQWFYDAIKGNSPNQLAYFITTNSCPFTKETLSNVLEGVLIRSRIKPLKHDIFVDGRIYLNAHVTCLSQEAGRNSPFTISVSFARYLPYPPIIIDNDFGTMGIGPSDYILQLFKESVESAVTQHIKANFDL
jgi:hypothetical protein